MFSFDPYSPAIDADPFPYYKTLRDEYPCFWSPEAEMWILSRYADIVSAGQNAADLFVRQRQLDDRVARSRRRHAGHDRRAAPRPFARAGSARIHEAQSGGPDRADPRDCTRAAESLRGQKQFDFITEFSSKFTVRVLIAALGLPTGAEATVSEATVRDKAVLMVQSDPVTRAKGPEHIAAYNWMQEYAASVIKERRANPRNDLISHFSTAEIDGDRLDEREVLLTTTTLIMAGIESLGGFMSMFAVNMAEFADARRQCVANPALLADAVEESLRFNTSAQRFRRRLMTDVTLHGQTMKQGDFVCLAYGSGNRDERQYPNPDVYDIGRKPRGHLGFGGGVHACLGSAIARLAIKIAFEEFHKVFPDYERAQQQLAWMPSSTFRSPLQLVLSVG